MSERDGMQFEESEDSGLEAESSRGLEDATLDPGARVEETGNVQQAEAIESAVTGMVENVTAGSASDQAGAIGEVGKILPENMPEQKIMGSGMDKSGAIIEGKMPGGLGAGPGSGVRGSGAGGVAEGDDDGLGALLEWGTEEEIAEYEAAMQERALDMEVARGTIREDETGDGIDDMNIPPYIDGSGPGGGEGPAPDGVGTPVVRDDTGKFVGGVRGGGGESGGTPGDPSGEDDSGKFLGNPNLKGGSDGKPQDPDELPYDTLDQAAKK